MLKDEKGGKNAKLKDGNVGKGGKDGNAGKCDEKAEMQGIVTKRRKCD